MGTIPCSHSHITEWTCTGPAVMQAQHSSIDCCRACGCGPAQVVVMMGGDAFFSNGIHLNTIEAAQDPALESWKNINAINDVVRGVFRCVCAHAMICVLGWRGDEVTLAHVHHPSPPLPSPQCHQPHLHSHVSLPSLPTPPTTLLPLSALHNCFPHHSM